MSASPASLLPMPPFPWQSQVWLEFVALVGLGRVPNAMLLHGIEGVGMELLANAMGQFILCRSPLESIACGTCKSCKLSAAQTHPDFHKVTLEEKSKQLKVDQIRAVSEFVGQTTQCGGYKVVVIEGCDAMNVNAANALLKNLEEPAGQTVFFLTTSQVGRLLPTIRSRCFQQLLIAPSESQAQAWFDVQKLNVTSNMLEQAGGAPLLARDWLNNDVYAQKNKVIDDMLKIALNEQTAMSVAQYWVKGEIWVVLDTLLYCVEACARSTLAAAEQHSEQISELIVALSALDAKMLFRYLDSLGDKKSQLIRSTNLNAALVIEELWLDWAALAVYATRKKYQAKRR